MLLNLHVKNLALIDEADVYFTEGLNILTGETGAGKSILLGSINLALGGKASKDMVREGADFALVELVFQIENDSVVQKLKELSVSVEENGQVILSRKIMNGKSTIKINGETVIASMAKAISESLIDIHGQHEHQTLLYKKNHLAILDEFAKAKLSEKKEALQESYAAYEQAVKKLDASLLEEEQRGREISFTEFELKELEEANLQLGEDVVLEEKYKKMLHGKKIMESMAEIYEKTVGMQGESVSDQVSRALKELSAIVSYDKVLQNMYEQLTDMESLINDFNHDVADYMTGLEFSEEEFYQVEERLNQINRCKTKYGNHIEEILEYQKKQEEKLERLLDYEGTIQRLQEEKAQREQIVKQLSEEISEIRKKKAKSLTEKVKEMLKELNFLNVEFDVTFQKLLHVTKNGWDDMEFQISTNPGESLKPLGKVASGGELSRIMLAIKTVLSDADATETLIFDEIDVGISGRTAQMVSEKMALIGRRHQVLCITHLPQIAAMADTHFSIEKKTNRKVTKTVIEKLNEQEIIQELARLLGGAEITENVMNSAKEMKELATRTKKY